MRPMLSVLPAQRRRAPIVAAGRASSSGALPGGCFPPSPGSSFDAAVEVQSVEQEYRWISSRLLAGWVRTRQSLVERGGRVYDVLDVRDAAGAERSYYFDVTSVIRPSGRLMIDVSDNQVTVEDTAQKACTLPSADSACRLMSGDMSALPAAAFHTVGRAALIAVGIAAAGERDPRKLARYGLGAALAIEVFALTWAGFHQRRA